MNVFSIHYLQETLSREKKIEFYKETLKNLDPDFRSVRPPQSFIDDFYQESTPRDTAIAKYDLRNKIIKDLFESNRRVKLSGL